jgi:MFS family permease
MLVRMRPELTRSARGRIPRRGRTRNIDVRNMLSSHENAHNLQPPETREVKARFRPLSLDALTFLLADVRGGLGPYLNVFLVTQQHWTQSSVGLMTTIGGLVGLAAQAPAGAVIDATRAKRGAIVVALATMGLGGLIISWVPNFWPVFAANTILAVAGALVGPAVAGLTLGLVSRSQLASRLGRNGAFDHAGNVAIATLAGLVGWLFGQRAVFLLVPIFAAFAAGAVLSIPAAAIDHRRARGADAAAPGRNESPWNLITRCRPLVVFALCAMLFHLANAPLLPLVGQKLALANMKFATAMMSFCIIAAQVVMLPIALFAARQASRHGRKAILLVGFAILPVRAILYTFSDDTSWLIAVQLLDGVGAGIFDVLTPLVVADLMRGAGHYNLALGAVGSVQGIGASSSGLAAGLIVDHFGYNAAFLIAAGVACAALLVLAAAMPETADARRPTRVTFRNIMPEEIRKVRADAIGTGRSGK